MCLKDKSLKIFQHPFLVRSMDQKCWPSFLEVDTKEIQLIFSFLVEPIESQNLLSERIKKEALKMGFSYAGIARVPGSSRLKLRTAALERWLDANYQAEMRWMENTENTPWYKNLLLLRQKSENDWENVLRMIEEAFQ